MRINALCLNTAVGISPTAFLSICRNAYLIIWLELSIFVRILIVYVDKKIFLL